MHAAPAQTADTQRGNTSVADAWRRPKGSPISGIHPPSVDGLRGWCWGVAPDGAVRRFQVEGHVGHAAILSLLAVGERCIAHTRVLRASVPVRRGPAHECGEDVGRHAIAHGLTRLPCGCTTLHRSWPTGLTPALQRGPTRNISHVALAGDPMTAAVAERGCPARQLLFV